MGKNRKKGQNPEKIWSDWMILLDKREPETPMVLTTLFSIFSSFTVFEEMDIQRLYQT